MDLPIILTIKNYKSPSWNEIYSANTYRIRKSIADEIHNRVQAACIDAGFKIMNKKQLLKEKVNITVNGYFNISLLDSDNIPAKLYIDGLKMILLLDDTSFYVGKVSTESFRDDNENRVEIIINKWKV